MKFYVVALSIVCLSLISCKKNRNCNCYIVTSGTITTHSQTAGTGLSIPGFPAFNLVQPKDTTIVDPYSFTDTDNTSYEKVSKSTMHKNCPASREEHFSDQSELITAGTSTVTTIKAERRVHTCKIE